MNTQTHWHHRFARRTALMKRSTIRELLKLTAQPGMISFAGGLPAPELFPVEPLRAAADKVLSTWGARCLQYGESEGIAPLRDYLAARYSRPGFTVRPENVAIMNGSQQALDLIGRVLLDEDDTVWVENPTYLALLSAWRPLGVRFEPVRFDGQGGPLGTGLAGGDARGIPDGLASEEPDAKPKALYAIPNYQNPSGICLSGEQRIRLAKGLRREGWALVEDDPYGELRYEGGALPHVFELNARHDRAGALETEVIYTSTFSKVLAPGLRLGYVIAAAEVIDKLVQAKQSADLHSPTFNQYLVMELLENRILDEQIPRIRTCYRQRRDTMLEAMTRHFPAGVRWTRPQGGMFLLVTLPRDVDASEVLPRALREQVAFVPGEDFHLRGGGRNTFRLNFSCHPPEVIEAGIGRLARVLEEAMARPAAA